MPKLRGKLTKEKTLEKLAREVDILERLQGSNNVVQLEDCFEDPDNVMIVTELCAGGDLQKHAEVSSPFPSWVGAIILWNVSTAVYISLYMLPA